MAKVEFVGRDLPVAFKENPLNIGAGWYQVECECADKTLIKSTAQADFISEDADGIRHYHVAFTYGEMAGAGITREPKLKLRTISADGHISNRYTLVEAINPPPVINTQPVVTPQLDSVAVTIQRPDDADLAGYLMAVSSVEVFDPAEHVIFDSTSNAFTVPINSAVQTYFARFAAYDEFGKDSLVWTTPQPISTYNGDFSDVLDQLDEIRQEVEDLQEEVTTKIGELEDLFGDRVEEALETIAETEERVNDMLAEGVATAAQFEQLGETLLQNQMQGVRETAERIEATFLADKPLGTHMVEQITRTDDLVETTNLIAVKAADGQSVILRTDKVFVQDGVSVAQKLEFMEAKTDQAKAEALDQITLTASELRAEADSKFTLQTEFGDFQSSVGQQFQSVSDATSALAQFQNGLGAFNADKSAIILDTSKVLVTPTESIAQRLDAMSTETADAKADALNQITLATTATKAEIATKYALITQVNDLQSQIQQNATSSTTTTTALAQFDAILGVKKGDNSGIIFNMGKVFVDANTSLSTKLEQMSTATADAKADALNEITLATTATKAEIAQKYALITSLNDLSATVTSNYNTLTTTTNSLASFDQILGAKRGDGQSIAVNTTKVYIDTTTTWSAYNNLIESRFNGTASSSILTTANTAASNAQAAANTLVQMGAQLNNGGAFVLDASKVLVSGGQSLATKLTSLQSSVDNAASTAYVDNKVSAATGPGSSLASQISSATTTANGASSTAAIALNAANGNTADIAILTWVSDRATGIKVNGATRTLTIVADKFAVIPSTGGSSVVPFSISNGTVYMDNVVARNIGANTITADKIVGGAITNQLVFETGTWTSFDAYSEMNHLTFNYNCEGGAVALSVYCEIGTTTNAAAGGVYRIYCDNVALNSGADYCTPLWGQKGVTIPAKSNPGVGVHTYRIAYQATPGSGAVRANRTYVLLTELKR